MAGIAAAILMCRTSSTAPDSIYILIALGRVLREINASSEHSADISVSLVEALLHDGIDERRAVEEHPLARLVAVLLGHLLPPMGVPFPQFPVLHLLNLKDFIMECEFRRNNYFLP